MAGDCRGERIPEFDPLSKEDFLQQVGEWYDRGYLKAWEHYHKRGKDMRVRVSPRETILCKYIARDNPAWKDFERFRDPIRTYRNKVVHNVQLGTLRVENMSFMPRMRIEEIVKYSSISAIQEALDQPETLKRDFVRREVQMFSDFQTCKERLNALWERPTADLSELLYKQRNPVLLTKYNLTLT